MKKNIGYKILALIITIIIWLQISLLREQTTILNIPLKIIGISDNLYLVGASDLKIPVSVNGRGINILLYYISDPAINYNGENIVLGNNNLDMSILELSLPVNSNLRFSVVQNDYSMIITTDRIIQKRVPLIYEFASDRDKETLLADDFIFEDTYVTISGPGNEIQHIEQIYTETIRADIVRTRTHSIRLKSENEHVVIIPSIIDLIKTTDIIISKTLPFIPILHDHKTTIFPQRVTVKIEGKPDSLSLITINDISAYVNTDNVSDNTNAEIRFRIPDYVKIIDYTPKSVNVRISP